MQTKGGVSDSGGFLAYVIISESVGFFSVLHKEVRF